jgi:tRNA-modifying protein YgfZ
VLRLDDAEIIDQGAARLEGLGAYAAAGGMDVFESELRHQTLKGAVEGAPRERAIQLVHAGAGVFPGHAPEALVAEQLQGITCGKARSLITFALEGEDGVGAGLDAAMDHAREMDAEERETRIGHGINQVADQRAAVGDQLVVFAAERDDLQPGLDAAQASDTIRLQAATVDQILTGDSTLASLENELGRQATAGEHAVIRADGAPLVGGDPGIRLGHLLVIDDAGLRHQKAGDTADMRLVLADFFGAQPFQPFEAVGVPAPLQLVQSRQLTRLDRHDELATAIVGNAVLGAEAVHRLPADHAIPGTQGAGLVIQPRVNDAAVVAGLMGGNRALGFQNDQRQAMSGGESHGGRQADDAAADDGHVVRHAWNILNCMGEIISASAEYQAATEQAAVFDESSRGRIELCGKEALLFLHNLCTNDVKNLPVGAGCEAFLCTAKAKVVAYVGVSHLLDGERDVVWLDCEAGQAERVLNHLNHYLISEQVELADRTAEMALLHVCGPQAANILSGLVGKPLADLREWQTESFPDNACHVRRHDWLGLLGFDMFYSASKTADLKNALSAAGARECDEPIREILRVEAGTPAYGKDIDEERAVMEVGRTRQAISYTKGCFLGQEPIVMARDRGHVNRTLMGVRLSGDEPVALGTKLLKEGVEMGQVRSCVHSPRFGTIGLAYIKRGFQEPGTRLQDTRSHNVTVAALPFRSG